MLWNWEWSSCQANWGEYTELSVTETEMQNDTNTLHSLECQPTLLACQRGALERTNEIGHNSLTDQNVLVTLVNYSMT